MSDVAAILTAYGQSQAAAARERGRIWGEAIQNIGAIPQQVAEQNLLKSREQRLNQQAASEQQLTDLRLRGEQRAQGEQDALDYVWSQPIWDDEGHFSIEKATKVAQANKMGHYVPKILEQGTKWNEEAAKTQELRGRLLDQNRESLGNSAVGLDVTNEGDWQVFNGVAARNQWITREEANRNLSMPPEARTAVKARYIQQSKGASERIKPREVPAGGTLVDPTTNQPIYTAPEKPSPSQTHTMRLPGVGDVPVDYVPNKDGSGGKWMYQGKDVTGQVKAIPPASAVTLQQTTTDAASIADAIEQGLQPPDVRGLYRMAGPVRAELSKRGYDLTKANLDWQAAQKHVATLNGAQQTRLRQAISTASDSLGVIEDLAKQWDAGKFPILNKVQLAAAVNGALGPKAQQIATNLQAQITDVTSELGNVYMGGNSPTDHALGLAQKNLSADWTKDQLLSAIQLARTNLKIRQNSIESIGAAGLSSTPAPIPTPTVTATPAPKLGEIVTVKGVRLRVTKINPDGSYEGVGVK